MRKLVLVISSVDKSLGFEWMISRIRSYYNLHVILLNSRISPFEEYLKQEGISCSRKDISGLLSKSLAFLWLCFYFVRKRPDIVHAHLFEAGYLGITAAWVARIKKRLYTRHYALIHHIEYPKGLKVDRWINARSTHLLAISGSVKNILLNKEGVKEQKVEVVHHGFDFGTFQNISDERLNKIRLSHEIEGRPVIGMISRFIELKGIQFVIQAFKEILRVHPNAQLVLANAKGDYSDVLYQQLEQLPPNSWRTIEFEEDVQALYQCFNVFVHVPISPDVEAFGQTYVEALASGVPSVFTLSGVAHDFIRHEENALVVGYNDTKGIARSVLRLLSDSTLENSLIKDGKKTVRENFSVDRMIDKLHKFYKFRTDIFAENLTS